MMLKVLGRALKILFIVTVTMAHWLFDRTGLRWIWWRVTGGGARRARLPTEALIR